MSRERLTDCSVCGKRMPALPKLPENVIGFACPDGHMALIWRKKR
jgi:hypothetical protein